LWLSSKKAQDVVYEILSGGNQGARKQAIAVKRSPAACG
jgi:hypothetical protein